MKHTRSHEHGTLTKRRRVALHYTSIAGALVLVSIAAIVAAGPGGVIGQIATYIILAVMILSVVVGVFVLVGPGADKTTTTGMPTMSLTTVFRRTLQNLPSTRLRKKTS